MFIMNIDFNFPDILRNIDNVESSEGRSFIRCIYSLVFHDGLQKEFFYTICNGRFEDNPWKVYNDFVKTAENEYDKDFVERCYAKYVAAYEFKFNFFKSWLREFKHEQVEDELKRWAPMQSNPSEPGYSRYGDYSDKSYVDKIEGVYEEKAISYLNLDYAGIFENTIKSQLDGFFNPHPNYLEHVKAEFVKIMIGKAYWAEIAHLDRCSENALKRS